MSVEKTAILPRAFSTASQMAWPRMSRATIVPSGPNSIIIGIPSRPPIEISTGGLLGIPVGSRTLIVGTGIRYSIH